MILWAICGLCILLVVLVFLVAIKLHRVETKLALYVSYLADKQVDMEKNLNTLAKVMHIYEEATQLVKKKYNATQIQERFQRAPR